MLKKYHCKVGMVILTVNNIALFIHNISPLQYMQTFPSSSNFHTSTPFI